MNNTSEQASGGNLQYAEVHGLVVQKGLVTFDGILSSFETPEHKAERESSRLARAVRKVAPLIAMALLGIGSHFAARHGVNVDPHHVVPQAVPAATIISNAGQAIVTNLVSGIGGTVPKFVMWGTGAGTAGVTDTTLFTETTDEARTTGTPTRVTTTVTNDTLQVVGTITVATSGKTITNVGLFDVVTASSGNLYFKSDFTGLPLSVADSITFTIKVKFS